MGKLREICGRARLKDAISDLESLEGEARAIAVAAVHVLKNELKPVEAGARRRLLFDREFVLPGGPVHRLRRQAAHPDRGWLEAAAGYLRQLRARLGGDDAELFRDRCDRYFWEVMVPVIEEQFGRLAGPFMNTINEAIINYAEYSFHPWAIARRVSAHIFRTEGDLAYAIIRPLGFGQRTFDPLSLRQKSAETLSEMRRGWGHTLLMRRALFISFDRAPRGRGMIVVVGPEEEGRGEPGR
ncbi:MAG: hypothetical protein R3325_11100 [Thermoanaerobaculia bacterium]|nr:hypothetical protein [Thermoanaerobaculia bacterium]